MKKVIIFTSLLITLVSCGTKMPYTDAVKEEFSLDERRMKEVQFFISTEIIMYKSYSTGSKGTQEGGKLIVNSHSKEDRIIFPPSTKCVFDRFGDDGEIYLRFETGKDKVLKFVAKPSSNNRYYIDAIWRGGKGDVMYGNQTYTAVTPSSSSYLTVRIKKQQNTQRSDRIVKGMKVR